MNVTDLGTPASESKRETPAKLPTMGHRQT